jgi:hypothetical protein
VRFGTWAGDNDGDSSESPDLGELRYSIPRVDTVFTAQSREYYY